MKLQLLSRKFHSKTVNCETRKEEKEKFFIEPALYTSGNMIEIILKTYKKKLETSTRQSRVNDWNVEGENSR